MIHHLILLGEDLVVKTERRLLLCGSKRLAIDTLGSIQCLSSRVQWTQSALNAIAEQCPCVFASWDNRTKKWKTFSCVPKTHYVNPNATWELCRLSQKQMTQYASDFIYTKVCNQHTLLRYFDPTMPVAPPVKSTSYSCVLRNEAKYAKFFWQRFFSAASEDLFSREKRKATHPLNIALNYGYGFLYHAIEWQCLSSGLEPTIGIVHRLRRNRPNLVCDMIEPFRCCVELTVMRNLDSIADKKIMAAAFAEMMESRWLYRGRKFRLRTIIRLTTESFVNALVEKKKHCPFLLYARDSCI